MIKEIFSKKENQLMFIFAIFAISFIFLGFYLLNKNTDDGLQPPKIPNTLEEIVWKNYKSKEFNFSVDYPEHFEVFEGEISGDPVINFYRKIYNKKLPILFETNESQFSIYPKGLSKGGANLTSVKGFYENKNGIKFNTWEYKTTQGKTWGIIFFPIEIETLKNSAFFIWISSKIQNPEYKCFSGGIAKDISVCDVYEGDEIYIDGEIDEEFLEIGKEFLNRIIFST